MNAGNADLVDDLEKIYPAEAFRRNLYTGTVMALQICDNSEKIRQIL